MTTLAKTKLALAKAKLASSITLIVLASFMIVTYDRQNMFIIQATGLSKNYDAIITNVILFQSAGMRMNGQTSKKCDARIITSFS